MSQTPRISTYYDPADHSWEAKWVNANGVGYGRTEQEAINQLRENYPQFDSHDHRIGDYQKD